MEVCSAVRVRGCVAADGSTIQGPSPRRDCVSRCGGHSERHTGSPYDGGRCGRRHNAAPNHRQCSRAGGRHAASVGHGAHDGIRRPCVNVLVVGCVAVDGAGTDNHTSLGPRVRQARGGRGGGECNAERHRLWHRCCSTEGLSQDGDTAVHLYLMQALVRNEDAPPWHQDHRRGPTEPRQRRCDAGLAHPHKPVVVEVCNDDASAGARLALHDVVCTVRGDDGADVRARGRVPLGHPLRVPLRQHNVGAVWRELEASRGAQPRARACGVAQHQTRGSHGPQLSPSEVVHLQGRGARVEARGHGNAGAGGSHTKGLGHTSEPHLDQEPCDNIHFHHSVAAVVRHQHGGGGPWGKTQPSRTGELGLSAHCAACPRLADDAQLRNTAAHSSGSQ